MHWLNGIPYCTQLKSYKYALSWTERAKEFKNTALWDTYVLSRKSLSISCLT